MIRYLRKFFCKLRRRSMEDLIKVQEKIKELSKGKPGKWIPFSGFHALTKFEFGEGGKSPTFHPDSGVPLKIFVNVETGELRAFPAKVFEKENG